MMMQGSEPELRVWTRHQHGNQLVRVFQDVLGQTVYETGGKPYRSARQLLASLYGRPTSMTFDRYFQLGRHRKGGRASGSANILTLFDASEPLGARCTDITVHSTPSRGDRRTPIAYAEEPVEDFLRAMEQDLRPEDDFVIPTEEMKVEFERSFARDLDRLEGLVGIDLGERSGRKGSKTKADEVRRLLWKGFGAKMLSQGYDPEDCLQEVYRGLLVRNAGKCPWDARKSTFGHYVHMCIDSILTNHHRKQQRRADRLALPLTVRKDGEEVEIAWGSAQIHEGSEIADMLVLEEFARRVDWGDGSVEAKLAREILPLVASGHQRAEIAAKVGERPAAVSKALAWIRGKAAAWALQGGMGEWVPERYRNREAS